MFRRKQHVHLWKPLTPSSLPLQNLGQILRDKVDCSETFLRYLRKRSAMSRKRLVGLLKVVQQTRRSLDRRQRRRRFLWIR